jgi:hypothetical protein
MNVKEICRNYFNGFKEISCKNNASKNLLAALKIFSYFTVILPLGFGAAYGLSSCCSVSQSGNRSGLDQRVQNSNHSILQGKSTRSFKAKPQFTKSHQELLKWRTEDQELALGFHGIGPGTYIDNNGKSQACVEVTSLNRDNDEHINDEIPFKRNVTAAYEAGLECGSKIIAVGGQRVHSTEELFVAFYKHIESQVVKSRQAIACVKIAMIERNSNEPVTKDFDISYLAHLLKMKQRDEMMEEVRKHANSNRASDIANELKKRDPYFNYLTF